MLTWAPFKTEEGGGSTAKSRGLIAKRQNWWGAELRQHVPGASSQTLVNSTIAQDISGPEMTSLSFHASSITLILSCLDRSSSGILEIVFSLKFTLCFVTRLTPLNPSISQDFHWYSRWIQTPWHSSQPCIVWLALLPLWMCLLCSYLSLSVSVILTVW